MKHWFCNIINFEWVTKRKAKHIYIILSKMEFEVLRVTIGGLNI